MNINFITTNDKTFFWSRLWLLVFGIAVIFIIRLPNQGWMVNLSKNYLPVHIILEMIAMLVSFSVFALGWSTYKNVRSADILLLSVVCFAVGSLDLGHTLSYSGMPTFITASGPNKAILFWLASRTTGSFGFLFLSLARPRDFNSRYLNLTLLTGAVIWVALWYWLILFHENWFPPMFVAGGVGLTRLKIAIEWTAILVAISSGIIFFRQGLRRNLSNMHWLGCSCFIFAMSGYFFTVYRTVDDLYNFMGHIYKAIAFILVYRALFIECISKPYAEIQNSAREALEANVSKSRFLANVSHEFRTPLGVIVGFSDMLLDSSSIDSESRKWTETISRNAKQLRALIDDLLDLAKAENEKISVQWSSFNLIELLEEVMGGLRLQAEKKDVQLRLCTDISRNEMIISDRVRLSQVLINLIGNAVKFTSRGEVVVTLKSTSPCNDVFQIAIQDSGLGIVSSQISRLFQPFSQGNDPTSRRFGGTGLGLALSKKLTALLGGELWLENSEIGRGSLFVFTVKNQKDEAQNIKEDEKAKVVHVANFNDLRILAAEDSLDNQSLLKLYLQPTGASMAFANNGAEAVQMADHGAYDLILMDIQMPQMDGFEAVEKLRQRNWCGPIVALSAHAHEPERNRALSTGFDGYLVKPITREKLWESIASFTNHGFTEVR